MWQEAAEDIRLIISLIDALLSLSEEKDKLFIANDITATAPVFKREQELLSQLTAAERRYQCAVSKIRREYHLDETMSLAELVETIKPPSSLEFMQLSRQLVQDSQRLQECNARSHQLMDRTKMFLDFNINILTQTVASDTYAPPGQEAVAIRKRKMFDQSV